MATKQIATAGKPAVADTGASGGSLAMRDSNGGITMNACNASEVNTTTTVSGAIQSVTASTVLGTVRDTFTNAAAGAVAHTLPAAAGFEGSEFFVWKTDSSSNAVSVTGLSGVSSINTEGACLRIVSDGATWWGSD